jgi:hypothetical protein
MRQDGCVGITTEPIVRTALSIPTTNAARYHGRGTVQSSGGGQLRAFRTGESAFGAAHPLTLDSLGAHAARVEETFGALKRRIEAPVEMLPNGLEHTIQWAAIMSIGVLHQRRRTR